MMIKYFRQKEHIKYQFVLTVLVYALSLCHLLMGILFLAMKASLDSSVIITDLAASV
jgi:hypothetical protein